LSITILDSLQQPGEPANCSRKMQVYPVHYMRVTSCIVQLLFGKSVATQEVECMFQSMWYVHVNTIIICEYKLEPLVWDKWTIHLVKYSIFCCGIQREYGTKVQHRVFIQTLNLQSNPRGWLWIIANDREGRKHEQYLCHLLL